MIPSNACERYAVRYGNRNLRIPVFRKQDFGAAPTRTVRFLPLPANQIEAVQLDACSQDAGLTDARDMPKLCLPATLKERHEVEQSLDIESAHRLTLREISNNVHGLPH